MAAFIENLQERWNRMNPREQGLVLVLGTALSIGVISLLITKIQSGMEEIEAKNKKSRKALIALSSYRDAKAVMKSTNTGSDISIPDKAKELDRHMDDIISELKLESPTYPALKKTTIGKYEELSFSIKLKSLDILQLTTLLEKIETKSSLVVLKKLRIDKNFRNGKKLDLDFTVATYRNLPKKDGKKEGSKKKGREFDES